MRHKLRTAWDVFSMGLLFAVLMLWVLASITYFLMELGLW